MRVPLAPIGWPSATAPPSLMLEALAAVGCPLSVLVAGAATADDEDERERRLALAVELAVENIAQSNTLTAGDAHRNLTW